MINKIMTEAEIAQAHKEAGRSDWATMLAQLFPASRPVVIYELRGARLEVFTDKSTLFVSPAENKAS